MIMTKTDREIELEKQLEIAIKTLESAFGGFKTIQHMAAYPETNLNCTADFERLFSGVIEKSAEIDETLAKIRKQNNDD